MIKGELSIRPVDSSESGVLAELGLKTFIQSHGHSASPADIEDYTRRAFSEDRVSAELRDSKNIFHLLTLGGKAIGYSKMIFNTSVPSKSSNTYCKLERIYVLSEYHGKGLGKVLMDHVIEYSKEHDQIGMCLYTWIENEAAITFYKKYGFKVIGQYNFRISPNHVNPNHHMLLEW